MAFSGFLMLEVVLWMDDETNMVSMARETLGRPGTVLSWFTYLFLLYALLTAFLAGLTGLAIDFSEQWIGYDIPDAPAVILMLLPLVLFVYRGINAVDWVNRLLMCGLAITFFILLFVLSPHCDSERLTHTDWSWSASALFITLTSFGYHIVIPSLSHYLERNVHDLKRVIMVGSAVPLVVYILWDVFAISILPLEGEHGLNHAFEYGYSATRALTFLLENILISSVARLFSLLAILTTILGVSVSLCDFLADGLSIKKTRFGRLLLVLLTFVPPVIIVLGNPGVFLAALDFAGAYGVVGLLALLPALMVWKGRYIQNRQSLYRAPGGKGMLLFMILLSSCLMVVKTVQLLSPVSL